MEFVAEKRHPQTLEVQMKIGVCLKVVPSTASRIKVADERSGIDTTDLKWEMNPYDAFALEEALAAKKNGNATEVIAFTLAGGQPEKESIRKLRDALALGADRAVLLDDPTFAGSDSLGVARILSAALKAEGVGLVFCGKQAVDDDNYQVPAMVAELLGWPQIQTINKFEWAGDKVRGWSPVGGGKRHVTEASLPAVISTDKALNKPGFPKLIAIRRAKSKPLDTKGASDIGLDPSSVGASAAKVTVTRWFPPPARPAGRMLQGDSDSQVAELVRLLQEEAKVL
jgi:electron transfer flavoprotein beta subunit